MLIVAGLFIRLKVTESPAFQVVHEQHAEPRRPIVEVLRDHPRAVLLVAGAFLVQSTVSYVFIAYLASYGTVVVKAPRTTVLAVIMLSAVVSTILHITFGAVSDRRGRKPLYLAGVIAMGVLIFPAFALFNTGNFALMLLAHILMFGVALSLSGGPTPAMFSEMFSSRIRYTGASLGYQLAGLFGAALSPIIAASLYEAFGTGYAIAVYVAATAVISFIAVSFIPESKSVDIVGEIEAAAI